MEEAHTLATSTQILMNVSEFEDVSKATDTLISAVQAFKYTAEESMDVVDILNTIGNNYAISTADLAQSLTKSSGSLVAANGTLEEAVALTATANTIIQDADVVGTALKTVAMRIRGTSTEEMEEEGLETDGMVESSSKLQSKIKGLSGVDILTDTGAYKSTYQILSEIAEVWESMNDMDQAALLELLAGKRAGSVMSAILQNPETLKDAFESASEATGSAMIENEKYLDSIQGHMDLFTNSLQTMWNNELNSWWIKLFVDIGKGIIQTIDLLGLIPTALLTIALVVKRTSKLSWGEFFTSMGTGIAGWNTKLEGLATRLGLVSGATTATNTALEKLTVGSFRNAMATMGVDKANRDLMLSQMGLTGATKDQLIAQGTLTAKTLEEAVANKTLTQSQAERIAAYYGLTLSTVGLTSASAAQILTDAGVDREQKKRIISALGLTMQTKTLTREEFINALAAANVGDANERAALATLFFGEANEKLNFSFKSLGKGIKNFYAQNKLLLVFAAIAVAIYAVIKIFDALITTIEEQEEKLTELNNALESTESKLKDLESELKEVQDRMKELNEQESLTFVEQEELDRLRAQSEELERQIGLNEQIRKSQQKKVNDQALQTAHQYENANFASGKSKEEYQETGSTAGAIIGGIGGGIAAGALKGSALLSWAGPWGLAIGAVLGALIGSAIGVGIGTAVAEGSNQVGEEMDNMLAERKKLEQEYNEAHAEYAREASDSNREDYEEAEKALSEYDSMMAEHLSKLDSYYSQIDLNAYDPTLDAEKIRELRNEMNDFYDTQDKWAIANGGQDAKNNAITRIFGQNASDELKSVKREIENAAEEAVKVAEETGEKLNFDVDLSEYMNPADLDAFTARLHNMGIYVYEVENYFKDMAQAEKEAGEVSLYGVVTDINKITEGLENLNSAFEEVLKSGSVTAKTLTELNEVFGTLGDSWDNYVNTMFSGVSSTKEMQEATEELAKAFIDSKILTGEAISEYERMSYIIQLRNLGVTNAEEYVDDKIQENAYKAIQKQASHYEEDELKTGFSELSDQDKSDLGIKGKNFEDLTSDEINKLGEKLGLIKQINAEEAQKIAEEYGLELENGELEKNLGLLQDKIEAEKELADKKKAQDEYNEWVEGDDGWKQTKEYIDSINKRYAGEGVQVSGWAWDASKNQAKYLGEDGAFHFVTGMTKEEFEKVQAAINRYNDLINSEEGKKWLNKDGTLKEGVEKEFADAYEAAKKGVDELKDQIETELTADIKLNLELQKKSDLVDQLQEVYDSLADAEKEYNENGGYISVDTLQSLLELEPKYLAMLYDENGQLNLNKQTILQVAQARTLDMGIQAAQNVITQASEALEANKIDRLRELTEVTYDQADANWTLVESNLAALKSTIEKRNADPTDVMYGQLGGVYEGIASQVYAIRDLTNKSVANIANSFSSSGNTAKADASDAFQKAMEYWENRIGANQARYEQVQNEIDLLEKKGKMAGEGYYQEQIKLENQRLKLLESQKAEAKKFLRTFKEGSDEWWEAANTLNDLEGEIDSVTASIQDLNDAMDQIHWDIFDKTHERFGNLASQLQTIRDLLSADEDSFFNDEGEWTETGVAVLGTYIQELEMYENALKMVQDEIKNLNINDFDSEQEYYDKKQELIEQEQDYAKSVSDSQQSVVDMYESQIDAVEEYTSELVDAYNEYIDVVKESLDAERDLYEFRKDIQKQTKDIASLERRIASLSGSDNAADIAERRKLEAELNEAKESLNDSYYDHAKDAQSEALDDEAEAYEESMTNYIDTLREKLDQAKLNMDLFMEQVTTAVTMNAGTVLTEYTNTGIAIDKALTEPWANAAKKMKEHEGNTLPLMNTWTQPGGAFYNFKTTATDQLQSPWTAGENAANSFKTSIDAAMVSVLKSVKSNVSSSITELDKLKTEMNKINDTTVKPTVTTGGNTGGNTGGDASKENIKALQNLLNYMFNAGLKVDGIWGKNTETALTKAQTKMFAYLSGLGYRSLPVGKTGKFDDATRRLMLQYIDAYISQLKAGAYGVSGSVGQGLQLYQSLKKQVPVAFHAKGILGTKKDEWAITDESWIGEEITLAAGKNGQLQYLKKGSAVMPADISANLVEWGKLDPNMMNIGGIGTNLNMISNAVIQPNYEFNFDSLVHVDHCDEGTLKNLEKMVDTKINDFSKQLNYSIKKFAR